MGQHPWSFDVSLGLLIAACGAATTALTVGPAETSGMEFHATGSYLSSVAIGAAIAVRRRWPLGVLMVVSVIYAIASVEHATEGTFSSIAVFIAVYTAGSAGRRPRAHWARAACIVLMAGLLAWSVLAEAPSPELRDNDLLSLQLLLVMLNVFYFAAAWFVGDQMYLRRQREQRLEAQAEELAAAQAAIAHQAVGAERMRIARELHDVVAHHVSVMGVQAGAARRILDRSPEKATGALEAIESSSRDAVDELHRLLGFLRQEGDTDSTAPPPTLRALPALVEQVEQAGVTIELDCEGVDDQISAGVDLSAYRIVQEALTNVVKHSGPGTRAEVTLRQTPDLVEVVVTDDGRGARNGHRSDADVTPNGSANGLVGMRERVALHGGSLEAGPRPDGGFELRATFSRRPVTGGVL